MFKVFSGTGIPNTYSDTWRIKVDNVGFAVICCLVIVRRVHGVVDARLLSNAFDLISESKFREKYNPNTLKYKCVTPVYQWANPCCLYTQNALSSTAW